MDELSASELVEKNIDSDTYITPDYLDNRRWASYRELVHEVMRISPENILEIGPGNKSQQHMHRLSGLKYIHWTLTQQSNLTLLAQ